jgi:NAD-dependent SIR2 family protein deacetylase
LRLLGSVKLSSVIDPEPFIQNVLGAHHAFECHECHWAGRTSDLRRETDARGGTELVCPNCGQARYIFPPKE